MKNLRQIHIRIIYYFEDGAYFSELLDPKFFGGKRQFKEGTYYNFDNKKSLEYALINNLEELGLDQLFLMHGEVIKLEIRHEKIITPNLDSLKAYYIGK